MRTWFVSLEGALTISALTMLAFVGYTLLEMRYFLEKWIPGDGAAAVETIAVVLVVGGWLAALFAARDGKRGGWKVLLALGGFAILVGIYDMQYALAPAMPWPERLGVFVLLIAGVCATVAVGTLVRSGRQAT